MKAITKHFPNPFDFLDGDRSFRRLHNLIDIFIDEKSGLDALVPDFKFPAEALPQRRRLLETESDDFVEGEVKSIKDKNDSEAPPEDKMTNNPDTLFEWEKQNKRVIPVPYNFRLGVKRAPIIQLGYTAFTKDFNEYFSGNRIGGTFINRNTFFNLWKTMKHKIDTPFITVCALNENWGVISTMLPNRTAAWGNCCNKPADRGIYDFLDHEKTLLFLVNQHSNISHPKVLTIPRGIPLTWERTAYLVWDSMRHSIQNIKRDKLLFASASSWGKSKFCLKLDFVCSLNLCNLIGPQILKCVSDKFKVEEFEGHVNTPESEMKKTKTNRRRYYEKLAASRFGLSLPGLGYDTFR